MQEKFKVSQRRACRVVGQHRASHRYIEKTTDEQMRLTKRMRELASCHARYGYRRITALLRMEGWRVNRKRVQRIWRLEGLRVPSKQRKRRRFGSINGVLARRHAQHERDVWSYDFVMDQTQDGRRLKMLPVVDEYTRECLGIEVARSVTARNVIATLAKLFKLHGAPSYTSEVRIGCTYPCIRKNSSVPISYGLI
ncbi:MAG: IS3 family transposase [Pyrinomonadaceae bacterium MAG19_C2-C3]|nr:IS3 family transposase [Pyrinomonadaceae bacterium MAG19_C2-C3]